MLLACADRGFLAPAVLGEALRQRPEAGDSECAWGGEDEQCEDEIN